MRRNFQKRVDRSRRIVYNIDRKKGKEKRKMDKAEILAQIMFEEDEIRYNNNEETIYFTKEDFEAELKERRKEK